jgi:hypothetical protein
MSTMIMKLRNLVMETVASKLITAGILFCLTLVTGVIVSRSGKPLNVGLVTLHKLIAVVAVVLFGMAVYQLCKPSGSRAILEIGSMLITGMIFLALIATGALLTRPEMQLPAAVLKIHQGMPLLALLGSSSTVYLLARSHS